MNKIERFLNNNMGKISFFLILSVLFIYLLQYIQFPVLGIITKLFLITEINKTIELSYTITTIGAIIAFWYGYKKYEKDKEIELIEKYTDKYNNLINKLYEKRTHTNYRNLFNLFYEEFFLKSKGYITDEL